MTGKTDTTRGGSIARRLDTRMDRRDVLSGAAALGAALTVPRITFAQNSTPGAASPSASPGNTPIAGPGGSSYVPSGIEGVPDAYLTYPQPFQASSQAPGSGGTVRSLILSFSPPPTPKDGNPFWQELEKRLNVTWEVDLAPPGVYEEKSATYLAGGDLPDFFFLLPGSTPQQYLAMEQGAFLDLTPYLTGDALGQFPNLARIPQFVWDNSAFKGQILGVPKSVGRVGNVPFYRSDWAAVVGFAQNTGPQSVSDMLTAFTTNDPDGNGNPDTFGLGRYGEGWTCWDPLLATQAFRVPYEWRLNADGTLTNQIETDEYRQALDYLRTLWTRGAYHPDSPGMGFSDAQTNFIGGRTGMHTEGFGSFFGTGNVGYRQREINPTATIEPLFPVGMDGQPGLTYNYVGYFGMVAIPATFGGDEEHVLELLRILDYMACPFGSDEATFLAAGIEGIHYERNAAGAPVLNDRSTADRSDIAGLIGPEPVIFYPENPQDALTVLGYSQRSVQLGIDNPVQRLYAPSSAELLPSLTQLGTDRVTSIVTGRDAFDSLDTAIQDWRDRGGDQIRDELQEALQQQG